MKVTPEMVIERCRTHMVDRLRDMDADKHAMLDQLLSELGYHIDASGRFIPSDWQMVKEDMEDAFVDLDG